MKHEIHPSEFSIRNPVTLAMIAAPFAAAGMSDADAIARAGRLLAGAAATLGGMFKQANEETPSVTLDDLRERLGLGEHAEDPNQQVRKLAKKALPEDRFASAWKEARAGRPAFTRSEADFVFTLQRISKQMGNQKAARNRGKSAGKTLKKS